MDTRAKFLDPVMIALAVIIGGGSILLLAAGGSISFTHFGWTERDLLLWDAFLSVLFFIQHSGMVRRSFRTWLARSLPQEYYGTAYSVVSGLILTLVVVCWQRSAILLWSFDETLRILALGVTLLVFALFVWSVFAIRSFDLLGIGPLRARLRRHAYHHGPFEVRGPYRWVRHPLYSGILVLLWVSPDITADRLLFNVLWSVWIVGATVLEERDLAREFGDLYIEYKRTVPMLVPWRRPAPGTM